MTGRSARLLHALGLLVTLSFTLFPFYWMVSSSLKEQAALLASPPVWLFRPTLANYAEIFADQKVSGAILNSLIVVCTTTFLAVCLARRRPTRSPGSSSAASATCGSGSSRTG